jgi:hypothetical protein
MIQALLVIHSMPPPTIAASRPILLGGQQFISTKINDHVIAIEVSIIAEGSR